MAASKALLTSIGNIPQSAQRRIKEGFSYLSALPPEIRTNLFREVSEMLKAGAAGLHLKPFADLTSLKPSQVASIINALSATITIAVQTEPTTEDFLSAAKGKFFDPEDEAAFVWTLDEAIANSVQWRDAFERRRLANETLPALSSFDLSVDLRLSFEDDSIQQAVAVALLHVDTDTNGQEVWFQAGRADVEMMLQQLEGALRHMDLAEQFYEKKRSE